MCTHTPARTHIPVLTPLLVLEALLVWCMTVERLVWKESGGRGWGSIWCGLFDNWGATCCCHRQEATFSLGSSGNGGAGIGHSRSVAAMEYSMEL